MFDINSLVALILQKVPKGKVGYLHDGDDLVLIIRDKSLAEAFVKDLAIARSLMQKPKKF